MRSAASRPCARRVARAFSAVARRSALRRACSPGSSARSCSIWARSRSASSRARAPASSSSRRRSVRSRKNSRIGAARKRTMTYAKMAKLIAGNSRSAIPAWCAACSTTSDRPSHHDARHFARDGTDIAADALAGGGHLFGDPAPNVGEGVLGFLVGLGDELFLLRLGPAKHLGDLALDLGLGLLDGEVVLLAEAGDLGFELTRRGHLALRANRAFLEQSERRIEPQPFEREPQRHEDQGFNDKAVVQIEHAERRAARRWGGGRAPAIWFPRNAP